MHIWKNVGPRKEPWWTPALIGCSWAVYYWEMMKQNLVTNQKLHRILVNEEDHHPKHFKTLDRSDATAWLATDLLKALAIVADKLIKICRQLRPPETKNQKRGYDLNDGFVRKLKYSQILTSMCYSFYSC